MIKHLILILMISAVSVAAVYSVAYLTEKSKSSVKEYITKSAAGIVLSILVPAVVLGILSLAINNFSGGNMSDAPLKVAAEIIFVVLFCVFTAFFGKKGIVRSIAAIGLILFIAETALAALPALSAPANASQKTLFIQKSNVTAGSLTDYDSGKNIIEYNDATVIEFHNIGVETGYISLSLAGEERLFDVNVSMTDDNHSTGYTSVYSGPGYTSNQKSAVIKVASGGRLNSLKIEFKNAMNVEIHNVKFNCAYPFEFSLIRFAIAFVICVIAALIVKFRLWNVIYNPKNIRHCVSIAACALICAASTITVGTVHSNNISEKYPLDNSTATYTPYIQQFDAFMKHRLDLDITVDTKLDTLNNPYDIDERTVKNVISSWDRSYFNGKYYSYYGVAPIFELYYPVYFLTSKIPTEGFACWIYASLLAASVVLLLASLSKTCCKKVNLLLLIGCCFAAVAGGNVLLLCSIGDFYCLPLLSALFNLCAFFGLSLAAYRQRKVWQFALAGVLFVMCVASRPITALFGLAVAPAYISLLADKKISVKSRAGYAAGFLIPVLLGAIGIMLYNNVRFGSPFDFGAAYQITVSDVSKNSVSMDKLVPSIYHYFIQPTRSSAIFPFVSPSAADVSSYSGYVYTADSFGVFAYPLTLSILIFPFAADFKKKKIVSFSLLMIIVIAVFMAFSDYCMGGVNIRYISDILLMLCLVSALILLMTEERLRDNSFARRLILAVAAIIIAVTLFKAIMLLFSTAPQKIKSVYPVFYIKMTQLLRW